MKKSKLTQKTYSYDVTKNAVMAIQERMNWYAVAIAADGKAHQGAGTLINFQGKKFVLTCRHVVEPFSDKDLRFIYRSSAPLEFVDSSNVLKTMTLDFRKAGRVLEIAVRNRVVSDEARDLALLEISGPHENLEFYSIPSKADLVEIGKQVYLVGFPFQNNRYWPNGTRVEAAVFPHTHFGQISNKSDRLLNFDPAIHFLIEDPHMEKCEKVDPKGLSGASVWSRNKSGENLWAPQIHLLGVQQSTYSNGIFKATRIVEVLKFLQANYKNTPSKAQILHNNLL